MKDLKERREKAGLTQAQLARRVGCNAKHLGLIERGKANPSADMRNRIEVALGGRRKVKERTPEEEALHEIWCEKYAPERKGIGVRNGAEETSGSGR